MISITTSAIKNKLPRNIRECHVGLEVVFNTWLTGFDRVMFITYRDHFVIYRPWEGVWLLWLVLCVTPNMSHIQRAHNLWKWIKYEDTMERRAWSSSSSSSSERERERGREREGGRGSMKWNYWSLRRNIKPSLFV